MSGFPVLTTVGDAIFISNNATLASVSGFGALKRMGGGLRFVLNPKLITLPSFSLLTRISGLLIAGNAMLSRVSGFGSLTTIVEDFFISDNASLTTISGFDVLTSIQGSLFVTSNAVLSSCCGLISAGEVLIPEGATDISNNATECSNVVEITMNCAFARRLIASPPALTAPARAGTTIFNLSANIPWTLTESADWITSISPENGNANQMIAITYVANPLITEREAILTLSATDAGCRY